MQTLKQFSVKILSRINTELINRYTVYFLVFFLWAPHGAKECIEGVCNGPQFVAPLLFVFLMPNWTIDMTLHGWTMQALFAPPLLMVMYLLYFFARGVWEKLLTIYLVRWGIMWVAILVYYNFVFWYGPLREYVFPLFSF